MNRRTFLFAIFLIGLLVVSLYRAKYGAKDTAAELMAVEAQIDEARHERSLLETELSHMSRREWIEEFARNELGMGPAKSGQIISEDDLDQVLGEPQDLFSEDDESGRANE